MHIHNFEKTTTNMTVRFCVCFAIISSNTLKCMRHHLHHRWEWTKTQLNNTNIFKVFSPWKVHRLCQIKDMYFCTLYLKSTKSTQIIANKRSVQEFFCFKTNCISRSYFQNCKTTSWMQSLKLKLFRSVFQHLFFVFF